MNTIIQLFLILFLSVSAAGISWMMRTPPAKNPPLVCDPSLLKPDEICLNQISGKVLWIDARTRKEWQENGIKGSLLWNMDPREDANIMEAVAATQILEAELVVVYCGSEKCGTSRQIAQKISNLGLETNVKILFGGWDAIKDSNLAP